MKKLVIMGAGGLAQELANAAAQLNAAAPTFEVLGFLDDKEELEGQKRLGLPVLGPVDWLSQHKSDDLLAIPATGNGLVREKFAAAADSCGTSLATIVHPSAVVASDCSLADGVFIAAGCVITVNVSLGRCALVNMGCTVAHDVCLGSYSSVHPGARISGEVTIKDHALVGTGAVVLNKCTVGTGAVVAMGAVVSRDVPDYTLVAGNPARAVKKLEKK